MSKVYFAHGYSALRASAWAAQERRASMACLPAVGPEQYGNALPYHSGTEA